MLKDKLVRGVNTEVTDREIELVEEISKALKEILDINVDKVKNNEVLVKDRNDACILAYLIYTEEISNLMDTLKMVRSSITITKEEIEEMAKEAGTTVKEAYQAHMLNVILEKLNNVGDLSELLKTLKQ